MNISEEVPDPYPWDTITILKKDLRHPEVLKGWLLSEVELRTSYPGTLERLMNWIYLAWEGGVQDRKTLIGLFSNALADKKLLAEEPAVYPKFFRYRLEGLKASTNPMAKLFFQTSKSLLTSGHKEVYGKAAEIREVLFERPLDPAIRLRLLLDLLPREILSQSAETPQELLVYGSISEATPSFAISSDEIERLLRSLISIGATPTKLRNFWEDSHLCLTSSLEFEEEKKKFDDFVKKRISYLRKVALQQGRRVLDRAELTDELVSSFIDELRKEGVKPTVRDRIKYARLLQETFESIQGRYIEPTEREKA